MTIVHTLHSAISVSQSTPFFQNLVAQRALDANQFSFYLSRGVADGSELSFGAIDSSKFTGETYFTPVTSQTYVRIPLHPSVLGRSHR